MDLERTPIWADIRKILNDGPKQTRFEYYAIIHTEKKDIEAMKMVMLDVVRDYVKNVGDETFVEVVLPLGDYTYDVYPYRDNLEITIQRKPLREIGSLVNTGSPIQQERYKAIFLPDENPQPSISDNVQFSKETLNIKNILHLKFMLMNRSLEPLRIKTTGGIFKKTQIKNVIETLMVKESNKVLLNGKSSIDGIQFRPPDNTDVRNHVIIPHGTTLTSVPTFCQEKMNGVYTAGIGTYLQTYNDKVLWFIYPLYNTDRFKENVNKAVFYSVPAQRYTGIERTYRKQGSVVYILSSSNKKYTDQADTDNMDKGIGFRLTDARSMMKKPIEINENGPIGRRGQLNSEVSLKDRDDNLNYAPIADRAISSNMYAQFSRIAERNGGTIQVVWENCDIREIYPGMPCKYVFMKNDTLTELEGVILYCHGVVRMEQEGITSKAHKSQCIVGLFVKKLE